MTPLDLLVFNRRAAAIVLGAIALAAIVLALALPASAQQPCGKRDKIITHLSTQYNESRAFMATAHEGSYVIEIFIAPDGETWTVLATPAGGGQTCITAVGKNWQAAPQKNGEGL